MSKGKIIFSQRFLTEILEKILVDNIFVKIYSEYSRKIPVKLKRFIKTKFRRKFKNQMRKLVVTPKNILVKIFKHIICISNFFNIFL